MRTDIAICVACSLSVCVMMRSWVGRADASSSPGPAALPLVRVPEGEYRPTLAPVAELTAIPVRAFRLMTRPVRNDEFLRFVIAHASYRRDRIPRALADVGYLADWAGPVELGSAARPHQPVTRVSWFAARAFCEAQGLRLRPRPSAMREAIRRFASAFSIGTRNRRASDPMCRAARKTCTGFMRCTA
jgi:hypothetical protein